MVTSWIFFLLKYTVFYMLYFQVLLQLLLKITQKKSKNLMGLSNVSMIMAPNLFLSPSSRSKAKGIREMEISMAAGTSNIVMMLIKYQDILWTVSIQPLYKAQSVLGSKVFPFVDMKGPPSSKMR